MRGRTHLVAGLATGLVVSHELALDGVQTWWVLQLAMVGSLLPDMDHQHSIIGRMLHVSWAFGKHRTYTHSALFVVLLYAGFHHMLAPAYNLTEIHIFAFMAGYVSHIVLDMLTPHGVALLYPSLRRWRILPRFVGGLPVEDFTLAGCLFACAWSLVALWAG